MTDPNPELLAILTEAQALSAQVARLETAVRAAIGQAPHAVHAPPQIADDADLDSQWGNPQVRKNPPRWQGQDCTGLHYADCPPEFLDTLAGFLDWQAGKADEKNEMANNGKPRSTYLRKDAARCRGWAARIRAKATAHRRPVNAGVSQRGSMNDEDGDVPF